MLRVSVLYREPKLLKAYCVKNFRRRLRVSVLYREPKLLKEVGQNERPRAGHRVSVLYREPKLLKGSG